jgi:hypothetical protein
MKNQLHHWLIVLALFTGIQRAATQGTTAFTYQGQLHVDGTNANGTYAMIFQLYDSVADGNEIGSSILSSPAVVNGLFTVNLDFGGSAFNGSARWLDIAITNGGTIQELSPRMQVEPVPYAIYSANAAIAASAGNAAIATTANGVTAGSVTGAGIATNTIMAANIGSGQVVKSVNGMSDNIVLQFVTSLNGLANDVFLTAGNNIDLSTNDNQIELSASVPNMEVFTNVGTSTFIVPSNVSKITVEVWGGGGGGGNCDIDEDGFPDGGSGGGAGGYGKKVLDVTPGTNFTVKVGMGGTPANQGGDSSFDSVVTATGGFPGIGSISVGGANTIGGVGGVSDAPMNITGGSGSTYYEVGGDGGNAGCGGSGGRGDNFTGSPESGQVPGGGGGGGYEDHQELGGYGGNGRVIVYY